MFTTPKDTAPGVSRIFVPLHLGCCGVPLLIALAAWGAFGVIGALLVDPRAAAAVVGLSVLAGVAVVRRRRITSGAACGCSFSPYRPWQLPFSENSARSDTRTAGTEPTRSNDDGTRAVSGVRF